MALGPVLFAYYSGNVFSEKPVQMRFQLYPYNGEYLLYFLFCLYSFGLLSFLIVNHYYANPVYYTTIIILWLLPLFVMGFANDLVMRVSIPALYVLMYLTTRYLFQYWKTGFLTNLMCISIGIILMIGAYNPLHEIYSTLSYTDFSFAQSRDSLKTLEHCADPFDENVQMDLRYNYYTYHLENSIFVKYFASDE